jgi:hypothetical protein
MKINTYSVAVDKKIIADECMVTPFIDCVTNRDLESAHVEVTYYTNFMQGNATTLKMTPDEAEEMGRNLIASAWQARMRMRKDG